ncbi:MAG: rSAM/selenodomain-associated transferase 2 [Spirosomataceae bacterium]
MHISVIIPTYNESDSIQKTVNQLVINVQQTIEIIISDSPNSVDNMEAISFPERVRVIKSKTPGRAAQMNEAANMATGDVLYFVHADTFVHPDFEADIESMIAKGLDMGCYRYRFDKYFTPLLYINSFFTRFNKIWCRGGDQTLFIKKEVFEELGKFREDYKIMEDYEILLRAEGKYRFGIIPKDVIVSSRKYKLNGYLKVQLANLKVMRMFLKGTDSQDVMAETYRRLLKMTYDQTKVNSTPKSNRKIFRRNT